MVDIKNITIRELTEYADYCMDKIPINKRSNFPNEGRDMVNEVRSGGSYHAADAILNAGPDDISIIIDIYDSTHTEVMAARIWLNNGRVYLIDWRSSRLLYDEVASGIYNFEDFKQWKALPEVPAGILKIPGRLYG